MMRRVRSADEAAAAVADAGLMTVFGSDAVPLPSLCEAVTGRPDVDVFVIGEDGRRHLNPELDLVWSLFTAQAAARRACLGKHLCGRLVLIAPAALASLPHPEAARESLAGIVRRHAPGATPRDLERLFDWSQPEARTVA